jgi:hypothetical protein
MAGKSLAALVAFAFVCAAAAVPVSLSSIGSGDPDVFLCGLYAFVLLFSRDVVCMYVSFRGEKGTDEPTPINNLESYDSSGNIITKVRAS